MDLYRNKPARRGWWALAGTGVFLIGMIAAISDAATIRGYVVDAYSSEPLPAASVQIAGGSRATQTNLDGYFVLDQLPAGRYDLRISYLGYQPQALEITAADTASEPIKIQILPAAIVMKEAVISRKKKADDEVDRTAPQVSTVPLEAKIIRTMPSLVGEMDILRALQTIPGVKASSDLSAALYVRGGSPDKTLILMDHNTVYNPSHMFGLFSTFNADAVKHLELLKGGFPAEYGGRSGSVLEVITNEGNRKQAQGLVSLGIVSARASVEGPLPNERGSYAASGRRTYMDPIMAYMRKTQGIDLPDYYFYDANSKINLDLNDRTTLTVAGYWGDDRFNMYFGPKDARMTVYMNWGNRTLSTRVRHALGRNMFYSLGAAVSRYHYEWFFRDVAAEMEHGRNQLYDWSGKGDLEWHLPNHTLETGFWVSQYDMMFRDDLMGLAIVNVRGVTNNYSGYVQDRWRVNDFIEFMPGIRGYYHVAGSHRALDPRLAMVYHYDTNLRFKVAGGRYSQFINLASVGEESSVFDLWIPVDKSMQPPYSWQGIVGCEWEPREDLEFTTETYYTDMHHLVTFNPMADQGIVASDAFAFGKGYAYGWEWMVQRREGRWNGWIGYSLSWTRQRFQSDLINNGRWFYPRWDRRHDFIIVGAYQASPRWELSSSWRYNTGQGYTQPLGIYTQYEPGIPPDYLGAYGMFTVPGSKNNYRFPADHRLDVTATYNHHFWGSPAKLVISIYNVYSRRAYFSRDVSTHIEGDRRWMEINDIKLLPILPMVSYEVRF